jgi:hypothetical protein
LCHEIEKLDIEIVQQGSLANITIESTIWDQIIAAQKENKGICHIKEKVRIEKASCFRIDEADVLWFKNRLVVPKVPGLRQKILNEAHLTQRFWWTKMKIEIARYVAKCDACQKSESCASEVSWRIAAIIHSSLEVGGYQYGLYSGFT